MTHNTGEISGARALAEFDGKHLNLILKPHSWCTTLGRFDEGSSGGVGEQKVRESLCVGGGAPWAGVVGDFGGMVGRCSLKGPST